MISDNTGGPEYEPLLDRLEGAEDEARLSRIDAGQLEDDRKRDDYLPIEAVEQLCEGVHPVRVWRKHRGLTREALAEAAGLTPSYVTEIERGKKPGSFCAMARLAAALRISLDDIAAWIVQAD